jgi:hypothetical protein
MRTKRASVPVLILMTLGSAWGWRCGCRRPGSCWHGCPARYGCRFAHGPAADGVAARDRSGPGWRTACRSGGRSRCLGGSPPLVLDRAAASMTSSAARRRLLFRWSADSSHLTAAGDREGAFPGRLYNRCRRPIPSSCRARGADAQRKPRTKLPTREGPAVARACAGALPRSTRTLAPYLPGMPQHRLPDRCLTTGFRTKMRPSRNRRSNRPPSIRDVCQAGCAASAQTVTQGPGSSWCQIVTVFFFLIISFVCFRL